MSIRIKTPPPVQVVVMVGADPKTVWTSRSRNNFLRTARAGMARVACFSTPSRGSARFREVQLICAIRESDRDNLTKETLHQDYDYVPMPDDISWLAGSRREWTRTNVNLKSDTVRIQADHDLQCIGTNSHIGDGWHRTPQEFAAFLGPWVMQFIYDHEHHGVTFAGFWNKANSVGAVGDLFERPYAKNSNSYFKEQLTLEIGCAGVYPVGWDFKEGAYRILDTIRRGAKTYQYRPVVLGKTRSASLYAASDAVYIQKLRAEFGDDAVARIRIKENGNNLIRRSYERVA